MEEDIFGETSEQEKTLKLLPAPELAHVQNLGVDVKNREVYLGEVEDETAEELAITLNYLAGLSGEPIKIWINSPGGDVTGMFAIHDLFRACPALIHTIGYGEIVSAAVLLLTCGHKRFVTESCVLMSHESTVEKDEGGLGLRAAKKRRAWEDWLQTYWCELMARYTPEDKDAKWWKRKTENDAEYWLLGGQAIVDAGLADEVLR
jgi:ATP-dependent Clp protease protease subunit